MSALDGLDRWSEIGARILLLQDAAHAERDLAAWIAGVAEWVAAVAPNSGMRAAWYAVEPIGAYGTQLQMAHRRVKGRLDWLKNLPRELDHLETMDRLQRGTYLEEMLASSTGSRGAAVAESQDRAPAYVNPNRITELRQLTGRRFSTVKLVRLCEELNECTASKSYLAVIMLVRAILDHVAPVFDCRDFAHVISQTSVHSLRLQLKRLDDQARDVANRYLHAQIQPTEALPTGTQVEFRSELDALLGEVAARLRSP